MDVALPGAGDVDFESPWVELGPALKVPVPDASSGLTGYF